MDGEINGKIDGWTNRQRYGLIKSEKHINE